MSEARAAFSRPLAEAIVRGVGGTWGDCRLQHADAEAARILLDKALAPHADAFVRSLADVTPPGGDRRAVPRRPSSLLPFNVTTPAGLEVDLIYDPVTRRCISMYGGDWERGLVGLLARVATIRTGRLVRTQDAAQHLLALAARELLGLTSAPSLAPTLDELGEGDTA